MVVKKKTGLQKFTPEKQYAAIQRIRKVLKDSSEIKDFDPEEYMQEIRYDDREDESNDE